MNPNNAQPTENDLRTQLYCIVADLPGVDATTATQMAYGYQPAYAE